MNEIEVSVVVAARNEALHLHEALESILQQKNIDFELIYVDDHSTDSSLEIANGLLNNNDRIRVFSNPKAGKCSAFNYGIKQAQGRFVCIFAGDDIMPADSLWERYSYVKNTSDEDFVVGICKLITMSDKKKFDGHIIPRAKGRGALSGVSPLMNKKAISVIFPTPEILPNEDTWMELALLHMSGWVIVPSDVICCRWRVHSGNSINLSLSYFEFNKRLSIRMEALSLFMNKFGDILDESQKKILNNKIDMETARRQGRWMVILRSPLCLGDRLRALSYSNALLYKVRSSLYGLLSGW